MASPLDTLAKTLGLLQTPSIENAQIWAAETRRLQAGGQGIGAAAVTAALKTFPAEFVVTKYNHAIGGSIEDLLSSIELL